MPYGLPQNVLWSTQGQFQSLIWVACPTGTIAMAWRRHGQERFNPSYGLHALRARRITPPRTHVPVSIPHMGCMPYGPDRAEAATGRAVFQSLIWVACPTGPTRTPHGGGPMGFNPSYGLHALRAESCPWGAMRAQQFQSLIWVACPTGTRTGDTEMSTPSFNPSYGLHALRAVSVPVPPVCLHYVSIPHMGCMPYGQPVWPD